MNGIINSASAAAHRMLLVSQWIQYKLTHHGLRVVFVAWPSIDGWHGLWDGWTDWE